MIPKHSCCIFLLLLVPVLFLAPPAVSPGENTADIVIYNRNFAVISQSAAFPLERGENTLRIPGLPEGIQRDSVSLKFKDPRDVSILEQKLVPAATQESLLKASEGKVITFEMTSPETGERWLREAKIIRAGRDPIVEFDGSVRFGLPGKPLFDALFEKTPPEPSLVFTLESRRRRPAEAELSYITDGIDWAANYNLFIREGNGSVDLSGLFLINSSTGKTFKDARVKLLAGDVSRAKNTARPRMMRAISMEADAAPAAVSRELDEYHLYSIKRPVTIEGRDNTAVEFLNAAGVKTEREYVFDGASREKVQVFLEFDNSEENQLGLPMPAGKMKIYRAEDNFNVLIGEDRIDHTPEDENIRLYTGTAFDLAGERKQTDHTRISSREREETYEITLRNRKEEEVAISVVERPARSDWEIRESSRDYEKTDARTLTFRVSIPPGEERKVSYTVRLRW